MFETKEIPISQLRNNTGQIEGVPKNPRQVKDARFEKLKKSIQDAPEMLGLRELLVVPFEDYFVVICGNMRLRALKDLKHKIAPCKVISDVEPAKLREYSIKDNENFGEYDWDIVANEWNDEELKEWGVELPVWESETEIEIPETDINVKNNNSDLVCCPKCNFEWKP